MQFSQDLFEEKRVFILDYYWSKMTTVYTPHNLKFGPTAMNDNSWNWEFLGRVGRS